MKRLTNNQKKYLRTLAHDLNPVVMIGQHGLSEAVLSELDSTMKKHELLKIKIRVDDRNKKKEIENKIIEFSEAFLVQIIGSVLVIYRPFEENPMIILPRK
ncbi:MAG: ribosome assembly RNA-binding protein YhbY [Candidatus Thioglobus sp.]|jgi:RNA-binding protein|nr:ribosome assembly RNA-binding protein YhbY [Candidatus Thioglobus sp.]|tara:strand:+ start:494 stop:796 length:303 start_codon:yes stop_codon:yes gene_type:complete